MRKKAVRKGGAPRGEARPHGTCWKRKREKKVTYRKKKKKKNNAIAKSGEEDRRIGKWEPDKKNPARRESWPQSMTI